MSGQERRLLELDAQGRYHVENYMESREGVWRLEGDQLRFDKQRATLESVDADTLVLVEAMPEIYLRGAKPFEVRNTYRRVSEAELGPMLGAEGHSSTPSAGTFAAAYDYGMSKYPTMEIFISRRVRGRARLELAADGSASACFGVAVDETFSESEYSSRDGKDHDSEEHERRLLGARGQWSAREGKAQVTLERVWPDSCELRDDAPRFGPLELECVALAANERLPSEALACRLVRADSMLEELALNPSDTERAGPYTMQIEPMGHINPELGRPWLILGSAPGLHVRSDDDRWAETPKVDFEARAVDFVERDFLPRPPAGP